MVAGRGAQSICLFAPAVLNAFDYGLDIEVGDQAEAQQAKGQQEVEVLIVGVQLGVGQRRVRLLQLLVAFVYHIASANT